MDSKTIRKMQLSMSRTSDGANLQDAAKFIQEIAAQLAELNEKFEQHIAMGMMRRADYIPTPCPHAMTIDTTAGKLCASCAQRVG